MAAITFLTGQAPEAAVSAPLAAGPALSLRDALRILRTPSSEAGVQAYHRSLEGEPCEPQSLLQELTALRLGRTTRLELIAAIATSDRARKRGVRGPGLILLRFARKVFVLSGVAARIQRRRADAPAAQQATADAQAAIAPDDIVRRLVLTEGAMLRLENRLAEQVRADRRDPAVAALEARLVTVETELRRRLLTEIDRSDA